MSWITGKHKNKIGKNEESQKLRIYYRFFTHIDWDIVNERGLAPPYTPNMELEGEDDTKYFLDYSDESQEDSDHHASEDDIDYRHLFRDFQCVDIQYSQKN